MQTALIDRYRGTPEGERAERVLRACVHCGFCNATCPTYELLGNELDGPRGRIYQMKEVLEGMPPTRRIQLHLDRCLTCRSCETTCPSGVRYSELVDIGREVLERSVARPWRERIARTALAAVVPRRGLMTRLIALGRLARPLLPPALRAKVPPGAIRGAAHLPPLPTRSHPRTVVMLQGCVQPGAAPGINRAAARVLDRFGITALEVPGERCCGAVAHHLTRPEAAMAAMRHNIDLWWPRLEAGAEAILVTASGCAAHVREYGRLLGDDPAYGERAARIAERVRDPSELLEPEQVRVATTPGGGGRQSGLPGGSEAGGDGPGRKARPGGAADPPPSGGTRHGAGTGPGGSSRTGAAPGAVGAATGAPRLAFHAPCTLQHALRLGDRPAALLRAAGFETTPVPDGHLCCGSAGTYSLLQPALAARLRAGRLAALQSGEPELIATANIGCLLHLGEGASVPVRHWLEVLDEALPIPAA